MSGLPEGWASVPLQELVALNPKNDAQADAPAAFMPMTQLGTRYRDCPSFETRRWADIARSYVHFAENDVLLAKITPCFENGKAGIARGLPGGIGAGSSEFFVCRPDTRLVLPEYLLAFFKTETFLREGALQMTGSVGHKRVPKEYLLDCEIPLPPVAEQRRIADKLDALLARVDACCERLQRVARLCATLRASLLQQAESGRLTSDWREARGTAADRPVLTVGDIATVGTGSTPSRGRAEYYATNGVPWITSASTGAERIERASQFVTPEAMRDHRLKLYPAGTLLVAMYGEGKTRGQVAELGIAATVNQACAAIQVDETKADRRYVQLLLQANYFRMRELAEGGNQPNLNLEKVRSFSLSVPCLDEQREVVRRAVSALEKVRAVERRVAERLALADRLRSAILSKAFRGELVPQDPADEPAQALLDRLKAAAPPAEPPRRGRRSARAPAA